MDALETRYDVFLSFTGADARTGFVDHLYKRLLDAGVHVFRDSEELSRGKEIGTELSKAITHSRIAIPIISQGYASSTRCLKELAAIMDCRRREGLLVLPVFYRVDVVDLGRRRGDFDEAFGKHEMKNILEADVVDLGRRRGDFDEPFRKHKMKNRLEALEGQEAVEGQEALKGQEALEGQEVLTSVSRIRGWISESTADGHEGELVQMVVAKVLSELKKMWIHRLPLFIGSVYLFISEKVRRESKCQVFLAFRGPDTRYDLADYLYASLVASGIGVFNHDDPSLLGKDFSNEISNAIDRCEILIPILSQNFSSSPWCLDELARMVDCKRTKGQKIIMPIFYKVDPSHVRHLLHRFGESMLLHEKLVDGSTYARWKRALEEVGSLPGWVSEKVAKGHEEVLVKEVVKKVSTLLKNTQTHDPPSPSAE